MKRMIALAAAGLLVASVGAPAAMAQYKEPAKAPKSDTSMTEKKPMSDMGHSVEGRVKSVNMLHTKLTLEDGTQLTIPKSVKPPKEALKKGAMVSASYEEKDGKKIITSIHVKAMQQS
jgi:Cu/Ag efflux protein CusF